MLSGQRSTVQIPFTTPESPTALATSVPPTMIMKAVTERTPAVQASLNPFRYFWAVGRSCSTP